MSHKRVVSNEMSQTDDGAQIKKIKTISANASIVQKDGSQTSVQESRPKTAGIRLQRNLVKPQKIVSVANRKRMHHLTTFDGGLMGAAPPYGIQTFGDYGSNLP